MTDLETQGAPRGSLPSEAEGVRYLSASKVSLMMTCPEKFRLKYVEKIPEPSSGYFQYGKVVHGVIERALKQQILGGKAPTAQEVDDWCDPTWDEIWKAEESSKKFIGWSWDDDTPAEAKRDVHPVVRMWHQEVMPTLKPALVEHPTKFTVQTGIGPAVMYGYLDLIEEGGLITDWKTANGKVSANALKQDIQINSYGVWSMQERRTDSAELRKVFLVRSTKPKVEVKKYKVGPRHRDWVNQVVDMAWRMVQSGAYVPNTSGWSCSEKWCPYWSCCVGELS